VFGCGSDPGTNNIYNNSKQKTHFSSSCVVGTVAEPHHVDAAPIILQCNIHKIMRLRLRFCNTSSRQYDVIAYKINIM
jgi:hypothetical protein